MRTNQQVMAELSAAITGVRKLTKSGFQVLDVAMGNTRPLITIKPPSKPVKGSAPVRIRHQFGITEQVHVAKFAGCLITWAAEVVNG